MLPLTIFIGDWSIERIAPVVGSDTNRIVILQDQGQGSVAGVKYDNVVIIRLARRTIEIEGYFKTVPIQLTTQILMKSGITHIDAITVNHSRMGEYDLGRCSARVRRCCCICIRI